MRDIPASKWLAVSRTRAWTEQGGRCRYCLCSLRRHEVTADHVVPRHEGGTDQPENIAGCCYACNRAKQSMSADRFRKLIRSPGFPDNALRSWEHQWHINCARVRYRINKCAEKAVKRIKRFAGVKP